ncbi:hypothetical protein JTE90_021330 [Oedothorax gibbosus]|uniref:Uncharacterized protein n=1 Tax=Oedothorax gibbosus TaxID=931172 RepID=A0AAV6VND6_9ARAC|nr:hypothetical protein JTE90_021330 [Oedothorax gibbosus]
MITQKDLEDIYYQHLTINTINKYTINKSAVELYQILKVDAECIDNRDLELETKCFPDLFPTGYNGMNQERSSKLIVFEYTKLRVMSFVSRFRLTVQYLFYLLNLSNIRQLASGIFQKMNTTCKKCERVFKCVEKHNEETEMSLWSNFCKAAQFVIVLVQAEKISHVNFFQEINFNKSLQARLWNTAMRSLNSR